MAATTDTFDLGALRLSPGEARKLELEVPLADFEFGGQRYAVEPRHVPVLLDISRMVGLGYALRLRFASQLSGPCMRCLGEAQPRFEVDAREVDRPGGESDEMISPYVEDEEVDLRAWAHDALSFELPAQIVCSPDCAGLCPTCGKNLNEEPHEHDAGPDPRWAKLRDLKLDEG
jgi:uncharacterized protein